MSTSRVVQVPAPGQGLQLAEREVPIPARGEVLVRIEACGVCHSDSLTVEGGVPSIEYPLVPGHEIAGRIEAVGDGVVPWEVGRRVGVGWFGGNCGHCDPCRRGDMISCVNGQVPGIAYDGGYADHVVVPAGALARDPGRPRPPRRPRRCSAPASRRSTRCARAAPGLATSSPSSASAALGHLGVQFARRMGFETVAIARGTDKRDAGAGAGRAPLRRLHRERRRRQRCRTSAARRRSSRR